MGRPKNILADTDNTDGRDKRFGNSVVIGQVSEINCDKVSTNVRVIMPDKVDHENNPLITKPVPVLQVASTAKKSFAVPRVGTNVAMIKMPNGTSNYLVIGGFYTTSDPPPVDDPMLDHVTYDDGSTMEFNASNGTLTWKLKGDMNYENEGAFSMKLKGNWTLDIEGDVFIKAPNIKLEGKMDFKGDIVHTGGMVTSKTHRDELGLHSGGLERDRISKLESLVIALEKRVAILEGVMATEGIYGSIVFGRARGRFHTFEEIGRKYSGRYGEHQVHLRKPLLEYGGPALVECSYSVNLDASWCGDPLPLLAQWHFYVDNALAAPLVVGSKPMGPGLSLFVITDLSEHHKHWLPKGRLLAVELSISFREYIPFTEGLLSSLGIPGFGGL